MQFADTEKVSVNLGLVDLGQIDLLIEQGFYSNRTDFIRTAVRNHLQTHCTTIQGQITGRVMTLGVVAYSRTNLERLRDQGKKVDLRVVGIVFLAKDISPELAVATISSVRVFGAFNASEEVKKALADRTES